MLRPILAAALTTAALLGSSPAQAGTHWSVGIQLPMPAVVVVAPARHHAPATAYYAPPPVVVYAPPPRVMYETAYRERHWQARHDDWHWRHEHHRREHHRHERWHHDHDGSRRGH